MSMTIWKKIKILPFTTAELKENTLIGWWRQVWDISFPWGLTPCYFNSFLNKYNLKAKSLKFKVAWSQLTTYWK